MHPRDGKGPGSPAQFCCWLRCLYEATPGNREFPLDSTNLPLSCPEIYLPLVNSSELFGTLEDDCPIFQTHEVGYVC